MNEVAYKRAETTADAVASRRGNPGSMYLAGGTTVVDLLKEGVFRPNVLVDIGSLALNQIRVDHHFTHIGALVSNAELAWNPAIMAMFPVVSQALLSGAAAQIRNMATTGGNILQKTRCPYYRDVTADCNRRIPGSGCAAIHGFNRSHAILGASDHCVATHPSDFAVALAALDARVDIWGETGVREVPITEFYLLPGDTPERETVLEDGELILSVKLPHVPAGLRSFYIKVRDRQSFEFALSSVAIVGRSDAGLLRDMRIALGGVGTVPWRARAAEGFIEGKPASDQLFAAAADVELAGAQPLRHNAFKVTLAKRTLVSSLQRMAASS